MNLKKIILSGLVAGVIGFIVGSALYMNPLTSGIYAQYSDFPGSKSMDVFGGVGNWLALMFLGGVASTIFLAALYSCAEGGIQIKPAWKKGAVFGFLLWLVAKLPAAYYAWLLYTYPDILNIIETLNALVGWLVAGMVLAIMHEKMK